MNNNGHDDSFIDMREPKPGEAPPPVSPVSHGNGAPGAPSPGGVSRPPRRLNIPGIVIGVVLAWAMLWGVFAFANIRNRAYTAVEAVAYTYEDAVSLQVPAVNTYDMYVEEYYAPDGAASSWEFPLMDTEGFSIDLISSSLTVMETDGASVIVEIYNDNGYISVDTSDNIVVISEDSPMGLNTGHGASEVYLYLPSPRYNVMTVNCVSGNISIDVDLYADTINFQTTSGYINTSAIYCDDLNIGSVSGQAQMGHLNAKDILLDTVSGDLYINALYCDSMALSAITGGFYCDDLYAKHLSIDTVSGTSQFYTSQDYSLEYSTISGYVNSQGARTGDDGEYSFDSISGSLDIY